MPFSLAIVRREVMPALNAKIVRSLICVSLAASLPAVLAADVAGATPPGAYVPLGVEMPPPAEAPVSSRALYRQEELDQMLAPIALYPDALIAHVLMAAAHPQEITAAARWMQQNPNLQGDQLQAELQNQPWDPSVKALTTVPRILAMMDENPAWTQKLGEAFLSQRQQVMDTIQDLRVKAQAAGNLETNGQQTVITDGQDIAIEPVEPRVMYVPAYNPAVAFGDWWWPDYPPMYLAPPPDIILVSGFYWPLYVVRRDAFWGRCDWRRRDVAINTINFNTFNQTHATAPMWGHHFEHPGGTPFSNSVQQGVNAADMEVRRNSWGSNTAVPMSGGSINKIPTPNPPTSMGQRGTPPPSDRRQFLDSSRTPVHVPANVTASTSGNQPQLHSQRPHRDGNERSGPVRAATFNVSGPTHDSMLAK